MHQSGLVCDPWVRPLLSYRLPQTIPFSHLWEIPSTTCADVFTLFETRPADNLQSAYNALNERLSKAHLAVYMLTAYQCSDCPSLVRGGRAAGEVVGETPEGTQSLVVYYLLRELIKNQVTRIRKRLRDSTNIVAAYVDAFERFTGSVNVIKSMFSYIHGSWQKRGLPWDHSIVPTEFTAMHLWGELMLDPTMREKLRNECIAVTKRVRNHSPCCVSSMELVKRLSMSLFLLNECRLTLYSSVIESPYLEEVGEFYRQQFNSIPHHPPEEYIEKVSEVIYKEEALAQRFLCSVSYWQVRSTLVGLLVEEKKSSLVPSLSKWLSLSDDNLLTPRQQRGLRNVFHLICGREVSWFYDMVRESVYEYYSSQLPLEKEKTPNTFRAIIGALKKTYLQSQLKIISALGEPQGHLRKDGRYANAGAAQKGLRAVVFESLKKCISEFTRHKESFDLKFAKCLAQVVSDEIYQDSSKEWISVFCDHLLCKIDAFDTEYVSLMEQRLLRRAWNSQGQQQLGNDDTQENSMLNILFIEGKGIDFIVKCRRILREFFVISPMFHSERSGSVAVSPLFLSRYAWKSLAEPSEIQDSFFPEDLKGLIANAASLFSLSAMGVGKNLTFVPQESIAVVRMASTQAEPIRLHMSIIQLVVALRLNLSHNVNLENLSAESGMSEAQLLNALTPLFEVGILQRADKTVYLRLEQPVNGGVLVVAPDRFCDSKADDAGLEDQHSVQNTPHKSFAIETTIAKFLKTEGPQDYESIRTHIRTELSNIVVEKKDVKTALETLVGKQFVHRSGETLQFEFVP